jgi:hypothetical protein
VSSRTVRHSTTANASAVSATTQIRWISAMPPACMAKIAENSVQGTSNANAPIGRQIESLVPFARSTYTTEHSIATAISPCVSAPRWL